MDKVSKDHEKIFQKTSKLKINGKEEKIPHQLDRIPIVQKIKKDVIGSCQSLTRFLKKSSGLKLGTDKNPDRSLTGFPNEYLLMICFFLSGSFPDPSSFLRKILR